MKQIGVLLCAAALSCGQPASFDSLSSMPSDHPVYAWTMRAMDEDALAELLITYTNNVEDRPASQCADALSRIMQKPVPSTYQGVAENIGSLIDRYGCDDRFRPIFYSLASQFDPAVASERMDGQFIQASVGASIQAKIELYLVFRHLLRSTWELDDILTGLRGHVSHTSSKQGYTPPELIERIVIINRFQRLSENTGYTTLECMIDAQACAKSEN